MTQVFISIPHAVKTCNKISLFSTFPESKIKYLLYVLSVFKIVFYQQRSCRLPINLLVRLWTSMSLKVQGEQILVAY